MAVAAKSAVSLILYCIKPLLKDFARMIGRTLENNIWNLRECQF